MSQYPSPPEYAPTPPSTQRGIYQIVLGAIALGLGLLAGYYGLNYLTSSPELHGSVVEPPRQMGDFTLTAHNGEQVSLSDFQGQVVLLYYGYTFCPDVCPATLADLNQAVDSLGSSKDEVQVLMVTVDPERDTVDKLAEYLGFFDPSFLGLTGTVEEIRAATAPYGIEFAKQEVEGSSGYLMDHTAAVLVLDREGFLRVLYPYGIPSEDIAVDLTVLTKEGRGFFN